ncbi:MULTISPECIES: response regulator [unclassified Janthinobacterium]|uniref:response regulator n=1 Tax=Janthinobacterium sp. K2C7 TaxID=2723080 RepID=UPI00161CD1D2|nr:MULTISPECIES: response regulator [unclassified Janthinobacterium]
MNSQHSINIDTEIVNATINILLVDDHTLLRSGVKLLLQRNPQFKVVGEASNGLDGVRLTGELEPDVVLMDLNMPGVSGLEALQQILQQWPHTVVLMLTVSEDAADLGAALRAGARGYLLKNIEAEQLGQAIRRAAAGESVIADAMTAKLVSQFRAGQAAPEEYYDKLTPREREAMACLARGLSNKEIARELDVAESTVKIHVQNILKKLKLSSRVQIAVYAVERGLGK